MRQGGVNQLAAHAPERRRAGEDEEQLGIVIGQNGAKGKGLDIVSGNVDRDRIIVGLDRKQLKGAMVARLADAETLAITVSVTVASELVPVIGMNLKRTGATRQSALTD